MTKQIGWFYLDEDMEFTNTYEFAAWYERVLIKAGKYPLEVPKYRVMKTGWTAGKIDGLANSASIPMEGVITEDYFAAHYGGVPVNYYDTKQNAGKESSYCMRPYLYNVADDVLNDNPVMWGLNNPIGRYELFPEYAAKNIWFKSSYDRERGIDKWLCSHGIFLKREFREEM